MIFEYLLGSVSDPGKGLEFQSILALGILFIVIAFRLFINLDLILCPSRSICLVVSGIIYDHFTSAKFFALVLTFHIPKFACLINLNVYNDKANCNLRMQNL